MEFRYLIYIFNDTCMAQGLRYEVFDSTKGWPKCGLPVGSADTEEMAEAFGKAAVRVMNPAAGAKTVVLPPQES